MSIWWLLFVVGWLAAGPPEGGVTAAGHSYGGPCHPYVSSTTVEVTPSKKSLLELHIRHNALVSRLQIELVLILLCLFHNSPHTVCQQLLLSQYPVGRAYIYGSEQGNQIRSQTAQFEL